MPEINLDDTICAIATASGEAALSIVRLSGPKAIAVADAIFRAKSGRPLAEAESFTIHYGHVYEHEFAFDECLASIFRHPRSFTKDDMIEFSMHGGTQSARKILGLCCRAGARVAEPGEFTKRAFLNGRINLTQAEAVVDIIRATSEKSLRQAVRHLQGELSDRLRTFKERLLLVLAHVEAYVDFPEEDHDVFSDERIQSEVDKLRTDLESLLHSYRSGSIIRNGILCVIVGRPNVGKSSLLNALLKHERAIVTEIPGTTRDTIEESVVWDGVAVRLVDTAGLGQARDRLDKMGMDRTRKYLNHADFYLWVADGSMPLNREDLAIGRSLLEKPHIFVVNKSDLPRRLDLKMFEREFDSTPTIACSALRGEGLDQIQRKVIECTLEAEGRSENVHLTRERHHANISEAVHHLARAARSFTEKTSLEFLAADLRSTLRSLSELIGEVYSDDILDVIFKEFCVGK
ncbi:MAG: tRNA uridine-5-carboxymethylaminomethyl(34) synthesis GTPase MnmE [Candidatus Omnitrophica bacterium]|nr:tRNA uridine-5-carboxymethylaminomethyl(34) synthesis GTPase MnmE [Candidatus Omnitrophota bacterium]